MAAPCGVVKNMFPLVKTAALFARCRGSRHFLQVNHIWNKFQGCRSLMSESFINTDVWRQRRKLDTNMNELSIQLDRDFYDEKKPVASVDLHKFIDNMTDSDDVEIAQGYLYCHRHSVMAPHLKDSTRHCWVRGCIDYNREDVALTTLKNRPHYGIFLDSYTFALFLDSYLKKNNIKGAVMVAIEMMAQEVLEESEPLLQLLALYSCHMYMTKDQPAQDETWSLGMTLADAGRGQPTLIGRSYHLLGYAMTANWNKTLKILRSLESTGDDAHPCIVQEAVDELHNILDNQTEKDEDITNQIRDAIKNLQSQGKVSTDSLDSLIDSDILNELPKHEHIYSTGYAQKLQDWHEEFLDGMRRMEEAERKEEMERKIARLHELRLEVDGLDYVRETITEEVEKQKEEQQNVQTAT